MEATVAHRFKPWWIHRVKGRQPPAVRRAAFQALRARLSLLGELARRRGLENEKRVINACKLKTRPPWMQDVRKATPEEDRDGIDVVVESDVGKLYVQVKSSAVAKVAFQDKRRRARVAVVVVRPNDSKSDLLRKVLDGLSGLRGVFLEKRGA
jgi:hypothetical protein